jgi:choice-of-anchor C domain-containing protein
MRLALACLALLAAVSLAATAPVPAKKKDLLVNGSFEDGPAVGPFLPLNPGSADVKGWQITRGQVDLVGDHWPAAHGSKSFDLHGSPGRGGIKQTFKTQPGGAYVVTFALGASPDGGPPKTKRLGVAAAGRSAEFTADATGKTRAGVGWRRQAWRFVAEERETTLEFYTLTGGDESCGPALDDVRVTEDR